MSQSLTADIGERRHHAALAARLEESEVRNRYLLNRLQELEAENNRARHDEARLVHTVELNRAMETKLNSAMRRTEILEEQVHARDSTIKSLQSRAPTAVHTSKTATAMENGLAELRTRFGVEIESRAQQVDSVLAHLANVILSNLTDRLATVVDEVSAQAVTGIDVVIAAQPIPSHMKGPASVRL